MHLELGIELCQLVNGAHVYAHKEGPKGMAPCVLPECISQSQKWKLFGIVNGVNACWHM